MSWISLVQYSTLGGIEEFYVEATDLHSPLCSNELSWWKCPHYRLINLPKVSEDLRPHSEGVGLNQLLLGCHLASGQAGPGKAMRGPSVMVWSSAFLCLLLLSGAGELENIGQPWSCDGPQSLPQSHLLSNVGATEGQGWYLRHPFLLSETPAEALADSPPTFWGWNPKVVSVHGVCCVCQHWTGQRWKKEVTPTRRILRQAAWLLLLSQPRPKGFCTDSVTEASILCPCQNY